MGIRACKSLRVRKWTSGRVAERSESSNPMIASGNHTDSNNGRPCGVRGFAVLIDIFAISG